MSMVSFTKFTGPGLVTYSLGLEGGPEEGIEVAPWKGADFWVKAKIKIEVNKKFSFPASLITF